MGEKKKNMIALICFGGESSEHDISIITALTIYKKYRLRGVDLKLVYVDKFGEMWMGEGLDEFSTYKCFDPKKFENVAFVAGSNKLYRKKKNKFLELFEVGFVFNCFHGGAGEDGRFEAMLENLKIPSSASDYRALGVAMDKTLTKLAAIALDIPVVDYFSFLSSEWENNRERVMQQILQFDFPVVVKPVSQGSSIGVAFAGTIDEFVAAVNLAFKFDYKVMVERAIVKKREFNVCLLKTSEGKIVAKMDEPIADKVIISFKDKYLSGEGSRKPTKSKGSIIGMESQRRAKVGGISGKTKNQLVAASRLLYENLDMNGVVRFDFLWDTNKEKAYLGEINAIPGSLGYYFFEDINLLKILFDSGNGYWSKRFACDLLAAPKIF